REGGAQHRSPLRIEAGGARGDLAAVARDRDEAGGQRLAEADRHALGLRDGAAGSGRALDDLGVAGGGGRGAQPDRERGREGEDGTGRAHAQPPGQPWAGVAAGASASVTVGAGRSEPAGPVQRTTSPLEYVWIA